MTHRNSGFGIRPCTASLKTALALLLSLSTVSAAAAFDLFLHEATSGNTLLHTTTLDHPSLNDNPDVSFIVSQVFNPVGDTFGTINAEEIGVGYSPTTGLWSIENQSLAAMPIGARFFVMVPTNGTLLVHEMTPGNTVGAETTIDDPQINNEADGNLVITYVRNPNGGGSGGPLNEPPATIFYDGAVNRWKIANQNGVAMPMSGGFFVEGFALPTRLGITSPTVSSLHHITNGGNSIGDRTLIDTPALNGNPFAFTFATLDTTSGTSNPEVTMMIYDFFEEKWGIFNQDGTAMPIGADFTVFYSTAIFLDGFELGNTSLWSSVVP